MNVPRWLNPKTNPALYTAAIGVGYAVWQAIQVEAATGPLTWQQVLRVAAGVVFAAAVAWLRGKVTPVADPRDGNGKPLVPPLTGNDMKLVNAVAAWLKGDRPPPVGLSDPERRRAENLRLTHAPRTPSFYPYPGETQASQAGSQTQAALPAPPPAGSTP